MILIDQHAKKIMEECKSRARDAGLSFDDETLEYIVTNQDMLELSPKLMIPTLYDYWVHDIQAIIGKEKYKVYPGNPYETVINTRPAVSFYNDNNPDWLNVMIFYHVLGHIDFFQNNVFFKHTWGDDFLGKARSDKRLIAKLRSEFGRWVDYIIEFSRSIDNLCGYYRELSAINSNQVSQFSKKMDYYFDIFLQNEKKVVHHEYLANLNEYNRYKKENPKMAESLFFSDVKAKYPEFETLFDKFIQKKSSPPKDIMEYILEHSSFINKEENRWMKSIVKIVRDTSLYFEPQRRDQIFNEGWASFWHEILFLADDRIKGHEVAFAKVHALVTSLPRVGLNPYALGMRLLQYIEQLANEGKISLEFQNLTDIEKRKKYNKKTGKGIDFLLKLREDYCDFTLVNTFLDQDFANKYKLFTVEKVLNAQRGTWQYMVKSKKAEDYKAMILDSLWHPPFIKIDEGRTHEGCLYLIHENEGKPLVTDYVPNTMLGIEYLWGGEVKLETTEMYYITDKRKKTKELRKEKVLYTMKNRKFSRTKL
ncbi:MAG: SpoVR family protein [Spirochaetes bacterium]|nr:SpoVR family protein [Spirochaetota bacterium]